MSSSEPRPRRVRLADVAEAAGVSLGAASKALSAPHAVRARTREAVQSAAERLGYIPNEAGRMLASRRTRMIGVVMPSLYHPVYAVYFHELQNRLAERHYLAMALSHGFDRAVETDLIARLVRKGVDALVLIGARHDPRTLALVERAEIASIFSWAGDEAPATGAVGFSDRAGMRMVVDHLAALGHRRIAMLNGDARDNERAHWRQRGVEDAAAAHGIDLAEVVTVPLTIQGGRDGLRRIDPARRGITAIVCSTDLLAAGVLHAAGRDGLAVPDALSVTGFDDIELAELLHPALTTLRVPVIELAAMTAELIIAALDGEARGASALLPVRLVVRNSTAAPR
jgi:LacI family transcriptional regulator